MHRIGRAQQFQRRAHADAGVLGLDRGRAQHEQVVARAGSRRAASADGSAAPGAHSSTSAVSIRIISPLTPRSSGCVVARGKPAAIDHDAVEVCSPARDVAVEFDGAAGGDDARVQFRQHAARLDMAFVGKNSASRKRPSSDGSSSRKAARIEPPVAGGQPGKAFEIGAVARMRHHQRAVERACPAIRSRHRSSERRPSRLITGSETSASQ